MSIPSSLTPSKYCLHILRVHDFNRYIASLFAPAPKRAALVALWAFHREMARLTSQVKEPLMGEIRLRWWGDEIEKMKGRATADPSYNEAQNPLLEALAQAVGQFNLPIQSLMDVCEAHIGKLYVSDLSGGDGLALYSDETAAVFFQLACQILDGEQFHLAHVACCYAGRLEILSSLQDPDLSLLQEHYQAFLIEIGPLPASLRPAFSSLATLPAAINSTEFSHLRRLWRISRASLTGYFGKLA